MAQTVNALATLGEVQAQGGGDTPDATMESLIEVASQMVTDYLLRSGALLYEPSVLEMPDMVIGSGRNLQALGESLYLRRYPISDVDSVTVAGEAATVKTVEASDLPLANTPTKVFRTPDWDKKGRLVRTGGWPYGSVAVVYSAGYWGPNQDGTQPEGVPSLPEPIKQAVILTTLRLANIVDRDGNLDLVSETTAGGWSQTWGSGSTSRSALIPEAARISLYPYKRKGF